MRVDLSRQTSRAGRINYAARIALVALILWAIGPLQAAAEEGLWSIPVNGLRGRLLVFPPEKADSPFCRVYIELQNVSSAVGQRKIRFDLDKIRPQVTHASGASLPLASGVYSGLSPLFEPILLPYAGTIRFQISFPGLGYSPKDKLIVDLGALKSWIIPEGSCYYLSGTFAVTKEKTDHPFSDWSGTLEFPKVRIPQEATANAVTNMPLSSDEIKKLNGLEKYVKDFKAIKVGMTRSEVESQFLKDGGIQGASPVRFLLSDYPNLKIELEFETRKNSNPYGFIPEKEDKVSKVGKPYIEWPFMD